MELIVSFNIVLETQYSGDSILLIFPDGTSPALLSALIAGIPLKDTHSLNFEPGEVRLDVTMDSTLQIFKDKVASPQYNEILERGTKQLETLRHELLLKQAEENAPPKPVPVSKPKTSSKVATKRLDFPLNGPDLFPVGAMTAIACAAMLTKGDGNEIETTTDPVPTLAFANGYAKNATETPVDFKSVPETRTYYRGAVISREERKDAADKAMEEYLNKDDGGDDWLKSMKDMMNE
jgi:hypothetical protein